VGMNMKNINWFPILITICLELIIVLVGWQFGGIAKWVFIVGFQIFLIAMWWIQELNG